MKITNKVRREVFLLAAEYIFDAYMNGNSPYGCCGAIRNAAMDLYPNIRWKVYDAVINDFTDIYRAEGTFYWPIPYNFEKIDGGNISYSPTEARIFALLSLAELFKD